MQCLLCPKKVMTLPSNLKNVHRMLPKEAKRAGTNFKLRTVRVWKYPTKEYTNSAHTKVVYLSWLGCLIISNKCAKLTTELRSTEQSFLILRFRRKLLPNRGTVLTPVMSTHPRRLFWLKSSSTVIWIQSEKDVWMAHDTYWRE